MALTRRSFLSRTLVFAGSFAALTPCASADERKVIRIGISGVEQQAEALYADETGLFRKAGLPVEIVITKGGAATVAALAAGALDVGCSNPISLGQLLQRKLPFVMLLPAAIWDTNRPTGFAVVAPDAPIHGAKDLNGRVLGVPSIGGLDHLLLIAFIQQAGGDPESVKFVELSAAVTVEALAQGRVAAAYLDEPLFTSAGNRIRSIGAASDAIAPHFAQTVWFASSAWVEANKVSARRLVDALIAAGKWATSNPEAAAGVLQKRLGARDARATVVWATKPDPGLVQVVFDRATRYNMLPELRASGSFWDGK